MRFLAKLMIILLTLFAFILIIGFIFNFSIVFPFTITNDVKDVPDHRLQILVHVLYFSKLKSYIQFSF